MTHRTSRLTEGLIARLRWTSTLPAVFGGELKHVRTRQPTPPPTGRPRTEGVPLADQHGAVVLELTFRTAQMSSPQRCQIAFSQATGEIDWLLTSGWLLGKEPPEFVFFKSEKEALGFFGRRAQDFLEKYYADKEKADDVSRHALPIIEALEGQVDRLVLRRLQKGLESAWQEELALRESHVTLGEARRLLEQVDVYQRTLPGRFQADPPLKLLTWSVRGEFPVARGQRHGDEAWVRVQGTTFTGTDAETLLQAYKLQRLHPDETTARHRTSAPPGS